ncbi:MAG: M20 family metallopeptidase [Actinomycetota bacterium]|nr:M20 family metallopeptidase [Actinomycetota bacterium]
MSHSDPQPSPDIAASLDSERLVGRLQRLVKAASENPPGEEAEAGKVAAELCRDAGGEVEVHEATPGRPNVVARWGTGDGPTLGFCSHIDVVPAGDRNLWAVDPYAGEIRDGQLLGRGACDAKGPIAAAVEAVEMLRTTGTKLEGTLELELVSDEEAMGYQGAGSLVEKGLIRPDMAIVGEPTSLQVVLAQRGACWLRITTHGKAAHGSTPERGRSAIRDMAEIVLRLDATLPDITHPVVGGPSINVGTIHGGEKVNIVAAGCEIRVDRRTIPGESEESVLESIFAAIELAKERFPDIDAVVEVDSFAHPFEVVPDSRVVRELSAGIEYASGVPAEMTGLLASTDARFLAQAGADVVVCGPGDLSVAHTAAEYIELAELERGAVAYASAFARLLAPGDAASN